MKSDEFIKQLETDIEYLKKNKPEAVNEIEDKEQTLAGAKAFMALESIFEQLEPEFARLDECEAQKNCDTCPYKDECNTEEE